MFRTIGLGHLMGWNSTRFRLRGMMFGQYLIMGAWAVTLPTFLMASPLKGGLDFPAPLTAWIYCTLAIAGLIAPLFVGLLADRLFPAQRVLATANFVGAGLLALAGWWCDERRAIIADAYTQAASAELIQDVSLLEWNRRFAANPKQLDEPQQRAIQEATQRINESESVRGVVLETFLPLFLILFGYAFCNVTSITLSNVIGFRNLADPKRTFGSIRLFGTIGWIAAGMQMGLIWNPISAAPLYVAAVSSLLVAIYSLYLPNTPPIGKSRTLGDALGLPALSMFRDPSFCVLIGCAMAMAAVQQFYTLYSNRFLTELQTPYPTAIQTIAQVSEVICMILFPFVLARFGMKWTMTLGLFCWICRNGVFATDSLPLVIALGLPLHGLCYAFFFLVAVIYIDRKAPPDRRASAQGIFTFVSMGAGTLLGNWISSQIVHAETAGHTVAWNHVWMVPTIASAFIFVIFALLFRSADGAEHETLPVPKPPAFEPKQLA